MDNKAEMPWGHSNIFSLPEDIIHEIILNVFIQKKIAQAIRDYQSIKSSSWSFNQIKPLKIYHLESIIKSKAQLYFSNCIVTALKLEKIFKVAAIKALRAHVEKCQNISHELKDVIANYGPNYITHWLNIFSQRLFKKGLNDILSDSNYDTFRNLVHEGADLDVINREIGSLIHKAVNEKNIDFLKFLLAHGADANLEDALGETPLFKADGELIDILLENDSNIEHKNIVGHTSLLEAALNGRTEKVKKLILYGADVNVKTNAGNSALHLAAQSFGLNNNIVQFLTESGMSIDIQNFSGDTPLHLAAGIQSKVLNYLLELGANIYAKNNNNETAIFNAVRNNSLKNVKKLIKRGSNVSDVNNQKDGLMHLAIKNKNSNIMNELIANNTPIKAFNDLGINSLMFASRFGFLNGLIILLDAGACINSQDNLGNTALMHALDAEKFYIIEFLISKNALTSIRNLDGLNFMDKAKKSYWISDRGVTLLINAARENNLKQARLLIKLGVEIDGCNSNQMTALHFACKSGSHRVVKILLKNGANIDACDLHLLTPFDYLCKKKDFTCLKYFKKAYTFPLMNQLVKIKFNIREVYNFFTSWGFDIEEFHEGRTVLHLACQKNSKQLVEILLENEAKIDQVDICYKTPLMIAAVEGHYEIVRTLLEAGANPNLLDNQNNTAYTLALEFKQYAIAELLKKYTNRKSFFSCIS